jgi:hypothetical protein
MRALYSLLSRLRTLYALAQGIVAFAHTGWAALTPLQLLTAGLVLCILLRVLTPSPSPARRGPAVRADHLLNGLSAASVVTLHAVGVAAFCASCVRLLVLAC